MHLQRRERLAAAQALGHRDGEDQRGERKPATLVRWDLFGSGRCGGARHHATDRLRLSRARAAERTAADERTTLADRSLRGADCPAARAPATHQAIEKGGIMKASGIRQ